MKSILLALSLVATVLSGCKTIPDAGRVLIGVAQVSHTSSIRNTLLNYLPSDSERRIARDLAFLDSTYSQFKSIKPDVSVVTLALEFPDTFDRVGESFAAIRGEVLAYSQASSIPIPIDLVAYSAGTIPAYTEIQTAIQSSDKALQIVELVRLLKPLVVLAL